MAKRKAEDELWELHKEEMCNLYEKDSKPLPFVMRHMATQYGFIRTYESGSLLGEITLG